MDAMTQMLATLTGKAPTLPAPGQPALPPWQVRISWHDSPLLEIVGFDDYEEACTFCDEQLRDPETIEVELADREGRLIRGTGLEPVPVLGWHNGARQPGLYRSTEPNDGTDYEYRRCG